MKRSVVPVTGRTYGPRDVPVAPVVGLLAAAMGAVLSAPAAATEPLTLTPAVLEAARVERPADLASVVAGLEAATSATGDTVFAMRGQAMYNGNSNQAPAVSVFVDGLPIASGALLGFALYDLERIDVRMGPQGVLYGRNTSAGAIDVIPARPERTFSATASLRLGNQQRRELEGAVGGALNDELAFRVAAFAVTRGGDQTVLAATDAGYQAFSDGRLQRRAARVSLAWTPTDTFSAVLVGSADFDDSDVPAYKSLGYTRADGSCTNAPLLDVGHAPACPAYALGADGTTRAYADGSGDPGTRFGAFGYGHRDNVHLYAVSLKTETLLNRSALTSRTGIRYLNRFVGGSSGSPYRDGDTRRNVEIASFAHDTRLTPVESGRSSWVLGFSFTHDRDDNLEQYDFTDNAVIAPLATAPVIYTRQFNESIDTTSVYVERDLRLAPTWTLSLGLRDSHEHRVFNYLSSSSSGIPLASGFAVWPVVSESHSTTGVPASLALSHQHGATRMTVSARTAYRSGAFPGGILPAPADPAVTSPLLPVAKQEKLTSFEAGFETTFGDPAVKLQASVFHSEMYQLQVPDQAQATALQQALGDVVLANAGQMRVTGLEARLEMPMGSSLTLQGAVTLQSARITTGPYAGQTPAQAPHVSGSVRVHYSGEAAILTWRPVANLDYRYRSESSFTLPNAATDRQGAYGTLGGTMGLQSGDARTVISAWARNLTNRAYLVGALGAGSLLLPDRVLYGDGRSFGVALSYTF